MVGFPLLSPRSIKDAFSVVVKLKDMLKRFENTEEETEEEFLNRQW